MQKTDGGKATSYVGYMEKSRLYYEAQGFDRAYRWSTFDDVPFLRPVKTLSESKVGFVTTAVPNGEIPKLSRTASSHSIHQLPESFRTDELSWDKEATHTDDLNSYLPLRALQSLAACGEIGSISDRFYFTPTEYSQRNTVENDAPMIVEACIEDGVDLMILVPL